MDGGPQLTKGETVDNGETPPAVNGVTARTANRVCIVGFADGHRDKAPFGEPDMEFWGLNRLHAALPDRPWHRWFELHSLDTFYKDDQQHQEWMRTQQIPIYVRPQDMVQAKEWGIETAVPYPVTEITAVFRPYFNNSISWLVALAIAMEYTEIHIYGVDMAQDSVLQAEYSQQRPSCEYFIGIAEGLGRKVVLPAGSDLLKVNQLYGFSDDIHWHKLHARLSELGARKEQMRAEMNSYRGKADELNHGISNLNGAMSEVQYNLRNLMTPAPGDT